VVCLAREGNRPRALQPAYPTILEEPFAYRRSQSAAKVGQPLGLVRAREGEAAPPGFLSHRARVYPQITEHLVGGRAEQHVAADFAGRRQGARVHQRPVDSDPQPPRQVVVAVPRLRLSFGALEQMLYIILHTTFHALR
jgi:hypothetical protein